MLESIFGIGSNSSKYAARWVGSMSSKQFKSVHLTNYYHPNSGGVKTNYDNLLNFANAHERYVTLVVPSEEEKLERRGEFGKIYYVPARPAPFADRRYRMIMPWQYILSKSIVRNILETEKPDMIEIYDNYSLTYLAGMFRRGRMREIGRPMLVYFTGERLDTIVRSHLSSGFFGSWLARSVIGSFNLPMFDYFIANSNFVAEELFEAVDKTMKGRVSRNVLDIAWRFFSNSQDSFDQRLFICPRGVDTSRFAHSNFSSEFGKLIRKKAGIPEDSVVLFSSTRLSKEKNVGLLVEIMKKLSAEKNRDYRLLVAGAGPKSDWLTEQTEKLFPEKIVQIGHLDSNTLAKYYSNVDIFLHPNPREPFGNVGLEALASGATLLGPNQGGILTYANEKNAWLVNPTPEGFVDGVSRILSNLPLAEEKKQEGLKTARNYSLENAIDKLFSTYDRMYQEFLSKGPSVPQLA